MGKRISGMQDEELCYPSSDPLRRVLRPNHTETQSIAMRELSIESVNGLGAIALETGELPVNVPRQTPGCYEEQRERRLAERRQFMAY